MIKFLLLGALSFGASSEKLVLRAERDYYGFHAQHALVLDKSEAQLTLNANFLCEPKPEAVLGLLRSAMNTERSSQKAFFKSLSLESKNLSESKNQKTQNQRHEFRWYVGDHELSGASDTAKRLRDILSATCHEGDWKLERGVIVSLKAIHGQKFLSIQKYLDRSKVSEASIPLNEAECKKRGNPDEPNENVWECHIEGFGTARLVDNLGAKT